MKDWLSTYPFAEISSKDGSSKLEIYTYGYEYPNEKTGDDADWLKNYLFVKLPGFLVEIDAVMFQGTLLNYYAEELKRFLLSDIDMAKFEPIEAYFGLIFSRIAKKIKIKGYVQYPLGWGANLTYEFETETALVEHFIHGISTILSHYPPRL